MQKKYGFNNKILNQTKNNDYYFCYMNHSHRNPKLDNYIQQKCKQYNISDKVLLHFLLTKIGRHIMDELAMSSELSKNIEYQRQFFCNRHIYNRMYNDYYVNKKITNDISDRAYYEIFEKLIRKTNHVLIDNIIKKVTYVSHFHEMFCVQIKNKDRLDIFREEEFRIILKKDLRKYKLKRINV